MFAPWRPGGGGVDDWPRASCGLGCFLGVPSTAALVPRNKHRRRAPPDGRLLFRPQALEARGGPKAGPPKGPEDWPAAVRAPAIRNYRRTAIPDGARSSARFGFNVRSNRRVLHGNTSCSVVAPAVVFHRGLTWWLAQGTAVCLLAGSWSGAASGV